MKVNQFVIKNEKEPSINEEEVKSDDKQHEGVSRNIEPSSAVP